MQPLKPVAVVFRIALDELLDQSDTEGDLGD